MSLGVQRACTTCTPVGERDVIDIVPDGNPRFTGRLGPESLKGYRNFSPSWRIHVVMAMDTGYSRGARGELLFIVCSIGIHVQAQASRRITFLCLALRDRLSAIKALIVPIASHHHDDIRAVSSLIITEEP